MHAGENPFSVQRIQALPRFAAENESLEACGQRFWQGVDEGRRVQVISGPHGSGKSRLLRELGTLWAGQGVRVHCGCVCIRRRPTVFSSSATSRCLPLSMPTTTAPRSPEHPAPRATVDLTLPRAAAPAPPPPEVGRAGPRPGALQRGRLCGHGKQRGKCRECRGEDGGEAMGGEASGRGAREDRRGARTPKPHAMTSMMRRLHHAADGGGSGWVMAASA